MSVADSGALLSTMAGAGATVVAIVAGLLVSRYVTLDSEQRGAQQRLEETTARRLDAEASWQQASTEWETSRVSDALDVPDVRQLFIQHQAALDVRADLLGADDTGDSSAVPAPVTYEQVLRAADAEDEDLDPGMVEALVSQYAQEAAKAHSHLPALIDEAVEQATSAYDLPDWEDLRRAHDLPVEHEGIWEDLWEELLEHGRDRVQQRRRARHPYDIGYALAPRLPSLPAGALSAAQAYQEQGRRLRRRADDAHATVEALRAEEALARVGREQIGTPTGLRLGLAVLALLAVLQLVLPLLFLAPTPATLTRGQSAGLVGAFVSGLVALSAYLLHYAGRLTRASPTRR